VIFFLAAAAISLESDGVMTDLVQKNRQADGSLGARGFDPVHTAAVVVVDAPSRAGHARTPTANPDLMMFLTLPNDTAKVGHVTSLIGQPNDTTGFMMVMFELPGVGGVMGLSIGEELPDRMNCRLPSDDGDAFQQGNFLRTNRDAIGGLAAILNAAFFHQGFDPL